MKLPVPNLQNIILKKGYNNCTQKIPRNIVNDVMEIVIGIHLQLFSMQVHIVLLPVKKNPHLPNNSHNINSEWLLFNANPGIFPLYHGENKLIFSEIMTMSALFSFQIFY